MKRVFFLLVLVTLGSSEVNVGVTGEKPSTENYQNYQSYVAPTGYYQYNNNNNNGGYNHNNNPGYNAYYPQNHQKQDLFNFGGGNGGGFGGGNGGTDLFNTDGFDPSSITGTLGAALAALGLKGITKFGIAIVLIFFFVIVPLILIPLILAIAAIIVAAVQMGGNGNNNKDNSWMDNIKQMMGKNDDNNKRALATFYKFMNNEECIEKISCSISQRAYSRSFNLNNNNSPKTVKSENETVAESRTNNKDKSESARTKSKGTFMSRIARALKADDCQVYSCSVMSYFS